MDRQIGSGLRQPALDSPSLRRSCHLFARLIRRQRRYGHPWLYGQGRQGHRVFGRLRADVMYRRYDGHTHIAGASGLEAYCRRFGNAIKVENVVEILLFDPAFPRSAHFSLAMLETSLNRIASQAPEPSPPSSQLEDLAALMRSQRSREAIKSGLHQFLIQIQDGSAALGDERFQCY